MKKHKSKKARNLVVTKEFLKTRADRCLGAGYKKQQWVSFCEVMLSKGFTCTIYEAKETYSKYITVSFQNKFFKVRFSNHKPIAHREENGDCDFFVGITNKGCTTTAQAVLAAMRAFA
jgi:hypothetical protein